MTAPSAITPFNFNSHDIRVIVRDGEPWFVAADVAGVLGYRDASNAGRVLDEDEKGTQIVSTLGGSQKLTIINESGLYALVMRSRKPEARKFAKWVTSEVLPAIRRTGSYGQPEQLTINQRVSRMIDQMDSVPIQLFMPLWAAINSRLMENTMPTMYGLGLGDGVGRRISH